MTMELFEDVSAKNHDHYIVTWVFQCQDSIPPLTMETPLGATRELSTLWPHPSTWHKPHLNGLSSTFAQRTNLQHCDRETESTNGLLGYPLEDDQKFTCAMVKVVAFFLGMGDLPPLIGLMTIPYYMEIMGV